MNGTISNSAIAGLGPRDINTLKTMFRRAGWTPPTFVTIKTGVRVVNPSEAFKPILDRYFEIRQDDGAYLRILFLVVRAVGRLEGYLQSSQGVKLDPLKPQAGLRIGRAIGSVQRPSRGDRTGRDYHRGDSLGDLTTKHTKHTKKRA